MIRALPFLLLLAACGNFPQVDAAAPKVIPPRPAFLSPAELAAANAAAGTASATAEADGAALRARADELRAR